MIRTALCALLLVSISGCQNVNSNVHDVNCKGEYLSNINLHTKFELIKIKQVRIDKNDVLWVRPVNTLNTHFMGGPWQNRNLFKNYKCTGEDYGLRRSVI